MPKIYVKFYDQPTLVLNIIDNKIGQDYTKLVKKNYENSVPVYRDRPKYTEQYMQNLARQAQQHFGWDWTADHYDLSNAPLLHKDLERLLGTTGFTQVPEQYDHLLHELHHCLHIVQHPKNIGKRLGFLQIEWFNDDGFDLDTNFVFQTKMTFGDLQLQNPFVGHGPAQIYLENDYNNIPQTCKFHNFVKPGIVINVSQVYSVDVDLVIEQFQRHAPEFVSHHDVEKIRRYTGFPMIGRVDNLTDLKTVVNCPEEIQLEKIEFAL